MKKEYVVTFLFNAELDKVWMIEKKKPEWQKGCLNGIGGKIEDMETPHSAALRELREESGMNTDRTQLTEIGYMEGTNNDQTPFKVTIFTGVTKQTLTTQESESIMQIRISELKTYYAPKHIQNVPALIELCLYKLTGNSNFKSVKLEY